MSDATANSNPVIAAAPANRIKIKGSVIVMTLYLLFLMLPIYWLLNMSLKTSTEVLN